MSQFLFDIANAILSFVILIVIAHAVLSWLVAFDVVNLRHPFVRQVAYFLDVFSSRILWPLQRFIPPIGGIDITPLIAIVLLGALQRNMGAMIFAPLASLIG